jgi:hypothetical protein
MVNPSVLAVLTESARAARKLNCVRNLKATAS